MKKIFGLITICSILAMPVLAAKPVNVGNARDHALPAIDVHIVKKAPLPPEMGEVKGKPEGGPPGQNKDKNGGFKKGAATGILGDSATGAKYAIIIGICNYPGTDYDICDSDGDSLRMYKALTTLYDYNPANIHLLKDMGGATGDFYGETASTTYATPNTEAIRHAIQDIKGRATSLGDEIVFFFSGHGADGIASDGDSERRDEGIVVHDSDGGAVDGNSQIDIIWDGELKSWFADFRTNRIAFVFDTCLAGGMDDLAAIDRVISMGTSETSVSYVYSSEAVNSDEMVDIDGDGQADGEGVFSHYFVNEGMLQGLADAYNQLRTTDNNVAVEEAFDYAKEKIENSGYKRQKPTISDNFDHDLLLGY